MNKKYKVSNPVLLFFYNRPDHVKLICDQLQNVELSKLIVFFDGSNTEKINDRTKVSKTREMFDKYNWDCELICNYSDNNMGCRGSILNGINSTFKELETAIVLEDDCNPTPDFFKFCDWALEKFENEDSIGMICGSNLVADKYPLEKRNGFSKIFSPWGWATWRKKWELIDFELDANQICKDSASYSVGTQAQIFEKLYWEGVFKHAVLSGSIWALILQQQIFKHSLLTVYPLSNLIHNTGYGTDATHTSGRVPKFVTNNIPSKTDDIFSKPESSIVTSDESRDMTLIKTVWKYGVLTSLRITMGNIKRYGL